MRAFQYTLAEVLRLEFSGSERRIGVHVEVDSGTLTFKTGIRGNVVTTTIPAGRGWDSDGYLSGVDFIELSDPDSTGVVVTFDIGEDAGIPGLASDIGVSTVKQASLTYRSIASLAGSSQVLMPLNLSRRYIYIENRGVNPMYVELKGGVAADNANSMKLLAGDSFEMAAGFVTTDPINILGTATESVLALEG